MAAITANRRLISQRRDQSRNANAFFHWRRHRHLVPLTGGALLLIVLIFLFLTLAWWYAP